MDGFVPQEDSASRQKAAGQKRQGIMGNFLLAYQRCADSRYRGWVCLLIPVPSLLDSRLTKHLPVTVYGEENYVFRYFNLLLPIAASQI